MQLSMFSCLAVVDVWLHPIMRLFITPCLSSCHPIGAACVPTDTRMLLSRGHLHSAALFPSHPHSSRAPLPTTRKRIPARLLHAADATPISVDGATFAACGRSARGCRKSGAAPGEVSITLGVRRTTGVTPLPLPATGNGATDVAADAAVLPAHARSLLWYQTQPCTSSVLYNSSGSPVTFIDGPVYAGADKQLVGTATLYPNTPPGFLTFTLARIYNSDVSNSYFWDNSDLLWRLYPDLGSLNNAIDVGVVGGCAPCAAGGGGGWGRLGSQQGPYSRAVG